MHAKTDSEVTSLAPSSPTRSPRRPVYYVQSPSRDSHDGEKTTTTSFHSTPILSPTGSPPHSHSSVGHHSRESSSSRFSGSLKPGSRKVSPNDGSSKSGHGKGSSSSHHKQWKDCDVIEEEGLLESEEREKSLPRRCYLLAFVVGFFVLFSMFSLILWGASRPQKPKITMKSIKFEQFKIQAGSDFTGVSTDMITMNSTVKMIYRNTGTFFGVHVTSSPLDLSYSQINIASGTSVDPFTSSVLSPEWTLSSNSTKCLGAHVNQLPVLALAKSEDKYPIKDNSEHVEGSMKKFYQSRKSQRSVSITVTGNKVPLYGSGASLSSSTGTTSVPISLKLNFIVRSRAYVLGKLVKPKFYKKIQCDLTFDPKKLNLPISLKKSCTYD
ncbi:hypothetical protein Goshw_021769 [Gossypium schwendimanii]|uniref:Late embryogenesis abundant protein LEA-2 subgroup domain-containing protein n=1 Tax=Gossypium schwendimanii TaxID=34291 RepID=A0A7J9N040_GOSSC|nr:hypothetical protein [Gossypium schwendimanii]